MYVRMYIEKRSVYGVSFEFLINALLFLIDN